jgi:transcriptional regulator with XRE-family HTH domain
MSDTMNKSESMRGNPGLKALREKAGLNRQQMAKVAGVTTRQWQRYENEGSLPDKFETVLNIAVVSGTPLDEVIQMIGFRVPTRDELLLSVEPQN